MREALLATIAAGDWGGAVGPVLIGVGVLAGGVILAVWGWKRVRTARGEPKASRADRHIEVEQVARDVEELTQRLAAELDRRAERIDRLIAAADQRIAALERPRKTPPPANAEEPPGQPEPVRARVYELADEGVPIVEIARRVRHPTGQVELMLALRRGKIGL